MFTRPPTSKRKHHPAVDWLLYAALRIVVAITGLFPPERNLTTARFLGRCLWGRYHRGRHRAMENLRASFPDKSEEWLVQTGRRSFEQLAMSMMDLIMTPSLVMKENWRRYSSFANTEQAKWMLKERKGMLLLSAHYGSFEIPGYMLGMFGFDIFSVARPLDNPYVNDYVFGIRQRKGQKLIIKKGASSEMEQAVAGGSAIGFISDQDAGRKGVFVDFFGRKASTYKSIGLLAMMHNVPIAVGCCRRQGNRFFFNIEMERIIMPQEWADRKDPLQWISQEYTAAIERCIRKDPTQYWWLHRRWKTRPKEELAARQTDAGA